METKMDQKYEELIALKGADGKINPHNVVKFALEHKDSALAADYEWDLQKAAYRDWLDTARRQIRLHVEIANATATVVRSFVSLSEDRKHGGGYRMIDDVIANEQWKMAMLRDALSELRRVRMKYQHLQELAGVFVEIDKLETRIAAQPAQKNEQGVPA